jgi:hypothetical protein
VDRHPTAGTERFEVLAQVRHAQVVGVLELGARALRDFETPVSSAWLTASP